MKLCEPTSLTSSNQQFFAQQNDVKSASPHLGDDGDGHFEKSDESLECLRNSAFDGAKAAPIDDLRLAAHFWSHPHLGVKRREFSAHPLQLASQAAQLFISARCAESHRLAVESNTSIGALCCFYSLDQMPEELKLDASTWKKFTHFIRAQRQTLPLLIGKYRRDHLYNTAVQAVCGLLDCVVATCGKTPYYSRPCEMRAKDGSQIEAFYQLLHHRALKLRGKDVDDQQNSHLEGDSASTFPLNTAKDHELRDALKDLLLQLAFELLATSQNEVPSLMLRAQTITAVLFLNEKHAIGSTPPRGMGFQ